MTGKKTDIKTSLLGSTGERIAAGHLRANGYDIVEKNYRCRYGEIDIIARKGGVIAFVEVKLRGSDQYGRAAEFVDRRKQEKLCKTALQWLAQNGAELNARFDVIEIYGKTGAFGYKVNQINHIENAFDGVY